MKLLLPLPIFVTMVTAAALPVIKIPVDGKPSALVLVSVPLNPSILTHTPPTEAARRIDCGAGVCWDGHYYYDSRVECFPDRTCDTGTCYHGYCYVDEEDIPWDDEDKPNNIDNGDNDNDNRDGDVAKRDGFWGIGDDDKIFREMMDDIHHRAKAKPSMAKRDPQSDEDTEEFENYFPPCDDDPDCDNGLICGEAGHCVWSTRPGMAKRGEPGLCSIPGECTPYGYVPDDLEKREPQNDEDMEDSVPTFCNFPGERPVPPPEKRDTNKDANCHNDEQCSPGICQDGICLLK